MWPGTIWDVRRTPVAHHSTSCDDQKRLHILPNVPCGRVARIIPVENHWFTTVRTRAAKKARCHRVTAGKQPGHPNYNGRLMAEQEVKTKAVIWEKKMWFKHLMGWPGLAWGTSLSPGKCLSLDSTLAGHCQLSPLWPNWLIIPFQSILFPRDTSAVKLY